MRLQMRSMSFSVNPSIEDWSHQSRLHIVPVDWLGHMYYASIHKMLYLMMVNYTVLICKENIIIIVKVASKRMFTGSQNLLMDESNHPFWIINIKSSNEAIGHAFRKLSFLHTDRFLHNKQRMIRFRSLIQLLLLTKLYGLHWSNGGRAGSDTWGTFIWFARAGRGSQG